MFHVAYSGIRVIRIILFVAQIKVPTGTFICATNRIYKYPNKFSGHFVMCICIHQQNHFSDKTNTHKTVCEGKNIRRDEKRRFVYLCICTSPLVDARRTRTQQERKQQSNNVAKNQRKREDSKEENLQPRKTVFQKDFQRTKIQNNKSQTMKPHHLS